MLLLLASVGNSIFGKLMMNKLPNYPYFLSQFTTVVYLPIFGVVVLWTIRFTNFITPDQYAFPKKKFAVMGLLDRYRIFSRSPFLSLPLTCLKFSCRSADLYICSCLCIDPSLCLTHRCRHVACAFTNIHTCTSCFLSFPSPCTSSSVLPVCLPCSAASTHQPAPKVC